MQCSSAMTILTPQTHNSFIFTTYTARQIKHHFFRAAWNANDKKRVRPSVRLSHAWIVTKRNKDLSTFLYHTKDRLAEFSEKKNGWWGATPSNGNFGSTGSHRSEISDFEPIERC